MKNIIDIKNSIIGVNISNINIIISNNTINKTIYTNKNTTDIKNKRIINNSNKNIFSLTQSGLGEWVRDGKRAKSGRREKERSARRRSRKKLKGWADWKSEKLFKRLFICVFLHIILHILVFQILLRPLGRCTKHQIVNKENVTWESCTMTALFKTTTTHFI